MAPWWRSGVTLLLGAGLGAAGTRILSTRARGEEPHTPGLLSTGARGEEPHTPGLLSTGARGEEPHTPGLLSTGARGEEPHTPGLLSTRARGEEPHTPGLLSTVPVLPVPRVYASELTVSPGASAAVMKYGFPSLANIKTRESYITSYDPRTRTASWVIERLNNATLKGSGDRKYCEFREDDSVHAFHRATNQDFRGSGFDRGHLAAAANHKWSQKAMEDTFYLSNVAPQNPHLNQNTWNNLEKLSRSLTHRYANVYVCTGPLYLPRQEADGKLYVRYQVLGRNHVAVPTHFFKVLILEQPDGRGVELRSYVLPNEPVDEKLPLERFLVPIETIERASGLLFVPNIMKRTSSLQAITAK